jgi:hypothetical protein
MTSEARSSQFNSPEAMRLLTYFKYSTLVTAIAAMLMLALAAVLLTRAF